MVKMKCRQTSNIKRTLLDTNIIDHPDGASHVNAPSTTFSFSWLQRIGQRQRQDEAIII